MPASHVIYDLPEVEKNTVFGRMTQYCRREMEKGQLKHS